jgi:hypothetical protein
MIWCFFEEIKVLGLVWLLLVISDFDEAVIVIIMTD